MPANPKHGRLVTYLQGFLTHKFKLAFNHMVLQDHMTNQKHNSTAAMFMPTKNARMETYYDKL